MRKIIHSPGINLLTRAHQSLATAELDWSVFGTNEMPVSWIIASLNLA